jgi:intracellular septation protein
VKTVVDFLPLALYLSVYLLADIFVATAVLIAAIAVHVGYTWATTGSVGKLLWVNLAVAAVLGGLALWWGDARYLVLRASAIYWIIAAALLLVHQFGRRNLVQLALQAHFDAPDAVWKRQLYAYVVFFGAMGVANIALGYTLSEPVWVAFDTVGALVLIGLFMIAQFVGMRRYRGPPPDPLQ